MRPSRKNGSGQPKRALFTYWALGGSGMAGVEYLTNLDRLPEGGLLPVRGDEGPQLPRRPRSGAGPLLTPFPGV